MHGLDVMAIVGVKQSQETWPSDTFGNMGEKNGRNPLSIIGEV